MKTASCSLRKFAKLGNTCKTFVFSPLDGALMLCVFSQYLQVIMDDPLTQHPLYSTYVQGVGKSRQVLLLKAHAVQHIFLVMLIATESHKCNATLT